VTVNLMISLANYYTYDRAARDALATHAKARAIAEKVDDIAGDPRLLPRGGGRRTGYRVQGGPG